MVKVEVIKEFTFAEFKELTNIKRKSLDIYGKLFVGDVFECNEGIAKYLTGENHLKKEVVKIIEIIPEEKKDDELIKEMDEIIENDFKEMPKDNKEAKINKNAFKKKTTRKKVSKASKK